MSDRLKFDIGDGYSIEQLDHLNWCIRKIGKTIKTIRFYPTLPQALKGAYDLLCLEKHKTKEIIELSDKIEEIINKINKLSS